MNDGMETMEIVKTCCCTLVVILCMAADAQTCASPDVVTYEEFGAVGDGKTDDHGAPYGSFVGASYSANVLVTNCVFTAHKTYRTIGAAGKPVSMGSYDISANNSVNVSFVNCRQTTDINDGRYWGIFGSNYCKNLLYDGCTFSRFDAHMGVANATVRNCELGYMGINAIGFGPVPANSSSKKFLQHPQNSPRAPEPKSSPKPMPHNPKLQQLQNSGLKKRSMTPEKMPSKQKIPSAIKTIL